MFLDYLSLAILINGIIMVIYAGLYIHDIPHQIAKKRGHPQTEAIHVACWLSLFTLHALWPLVFIWAVSNQERLSGKNVNTNLLEEKIESLQNKITQLEQCITAGDHKNA